MRFFVAPLLLSLFAQQGPPRAAAPSPANATNATMSAYHNDDLHLTYTYPSTYTDASSVVGPAFEASVSGDPASAAEARCISLPFSRMETGTGQIGILLLVRADAGCLKKKFNAKSLAEFTQGEARGLAASGAQTTFGDPVNFEIDSRPAALLRGTFTLPAGKPMHAMVVCVLDQPDVACWQFLASTADRLSTMSSFPVSFGTGPAAPLVPANLIPQP